MCRVCVEEFESREFMNKLTYRDGMITVDLVRGKEPPPSVLAASGTGPETERRTSKRPRRGTASTSGRVSLCVSSETTIYQLKLQIWEALLVSLCFNGVDFCAFEPVMNFLLFHTVQCPEFDSNATYLV